MTPVLLTPRDLALAATLIVLDSGLSLALGLRLHRPLLIAAARMAVQLLLVGYVLRAVFALHSAAVTVLVVAVMTAVAAREVAARPEQRLAAFGNYSIGGAVVAAVTGITAVLALTTAIRPQPWWDPRYAIPLAGIILGSVLNAGSIALDGILGGVERERGAIEARLALGESYRTAMQPLLRKAMRRALLPIVNQMSAAGLITLPGIMTGQIIAGLDPLEAVKYQILLMFLLGGSSFLAALGIATLATRRLTDTRARLRLDRLRGR